MLCTYNDTTQTVNINSAVIFNANAVQTGIVATHTPGTAAIDLNKPGFYQINFSADVAGVGNIEIQMYNNGVLVPGAEGTKTSTAVTDLGNIDFPYIVKVCPDPCRLKCECNTLATLTFVNIGTVAATMENAVLTVSKIA